MATKAQILQELSRQSFTAGWGAIAVFDGAHVAPMLADYYTAKVYGHQTLDTINAEKIPFSTEQEVYGTLANLVLESPRLSFVPATLLDSRVRVSFKFHSGLYSELQRSAGSPLAINEMINVGTGQDYTFSMEVNLNDAVGTVDADGNVRVTVGPAANPLCNLGSTAVARRKIAEFLLEVLRPAQGAPLVIPLGALATQRGFMLPTDIRFKTQAKPGSANGEGALLAFMARRRTPEDPLGSFPTELPYLIPDDNDAQNRPYSATLLVSRSYAPLRAGEYASVIGQVLFPLESNFKVSEVHAEFPGPRDIAVFGRIEAPAITARVNEDLRNVPGASTHVLRVIATATAQPIEMIASSTVAHGWTWELLHADLGSLEGQGATGTYTPPSALLDEWFDDVSNKWIYPWRADVPAGAPRRKSRVRIQRVIARNRSTNPELRREVCILVESGVVRKLAEFVEPVHAAVAPDSRITTEVIFDPGFDFTSAFDVEGRGTASNSTYRAPTGAGNDIELLVGTFSTETGTMFAYGYSIMQLADTQDIPYWTELNAFTLKADYPGARPLANGMQQLAIEVLVESRGDTPVSDKELESMRLVQRHGAELPWIADTEQGLAPPPAGQTGSWAVRRRPNAFNQATTNAQAVAPVHPAQARTVKLYVQTTSDTPIDLVARFTDSHNNVHTSNIPSGEEGNFKVIRVSPLRVPVDDESHFDITVTRVAGGHQSRPENPGWTPENPNFDWNLRTTDYWTFRLKDGPNVLRIQRLQWHEDGPGVKWESEAQNEDAFSFMGYALIPEGDKPEFLEFANTLYNPVLWDGHSGFQNGLPPEARLRANAAGSVGTLVLALTRVTDVYYRQKALIPGFELDRTEPFKTTLWDTNGTRHRLEFSFIAAHRNAPTFNLW